MRELAKSLVAGAIVSAELVYLGHALWRILDPEAPELGELVERVRGELRERAAYREAVRRTLSSIRDLPETETDEC